MLYRIYVLFEYLICLNIYQNNMKYWTFIWLISMISCDGDNQEKRWKWDFSVWKGYPVYFQRAYIVNARLKHAFLLNKARDRKQLYRLNETKSHSGGV